VTTLRGDRGPTGLGQALRAARAERGLSLAELQARTKIRARYLTALEEERFGDLPPYPFSRGFVHAVATELGLDPAPLVDRLAASLRAGDPTRTAGWRRLDAALEPAVRPSRARRLATWAIVLAVMVAGAVAIDFGMQMRQLSRPATRPSPLAGMGAPEGLPSAGPAPPAVTAPSSTPAVAPPGPSEPPGRREGVVVDMEASGRSWVRVVADGREVFVGFITIGERRAWEGRQSVVVRLGNAGAVAVTVNGRALGPIGALGQVVERTFRREGIP
jgi:cytoskeletal protein RodZ